jgi:hypothetical protein
MPLINWVAGDLRHHGHTVLIPATYPPFTMTDKDLAGTYFWQKIAALRDSRVLLWEDLEKANALLMDANFVTQNPTKYSACNLNNALEYVGKAQSLLTSAQNLAFGVDTFVANLFGAQAPAPSSGRYPTPSAAGAAAPSATGNAPAGANPPSSTTPPATTPAAASPNASAANPQAAGGGGQSAQNSPAPANTQQTNISLPQILASDMLAQRLFNSKPIIERSDIDSVNFLTLHALESGGSELVKTNALFTHIYFSGGSTATFSLYRLQGDMQCSGTVLNYIGNVREKNVERRLAADDIGHDAKISWFSCVDARNSHAAVHEGMSRAEVENAFGKPDEQFHKRDVYYYRERDTIVEFRKGVVSRIAAAGRPRQATLAGGALE